MCHAYHAEFALLFVVARCVSLVWMSQSTNASDFRSPLRDGQVRPLHKNLDGLGK